MSCIWHYGGSSCFIHFAEDERVASVFPNKRRKLHTTRSWDFLGLPLSLQNKNLNMENDIVIGILDTGDLCSSRDWYRKSDTWLCHFSKRFGLLSLWNLHHVGIYVGAPSFNDQGYGPAPTKWKGKCTVAFNFTGCNKYLSVPNHLQLDIWKTMSQQLLRRWQPMISLNWRMN